MGATIHYKDGWPTAEIPVEASASIGADGLVTGTAKFIVEEGSAVYQINDAVAAGIFKALSGVSVQGLYVEERAARKENGLNTLTISVVGAINPPIIVRSKSSSTASYSESKSYQEDDVEKSNTYTAAYIAETTQAICWLKKDSLFEFSADNPILVKVFSQTGRGQLLGPNSSWADGIGAGINDPGFIQKTLIPIETETLEHRSGLKKITKTKQLVVS